MPDETFTTGDIGTCAAELMEMLEDHYEGKAKLGVFAMIVEVNIDNEDGSGFTEMMYRCNDPRRWVQAAIFHTAYRYVAAVGPESG
jgi:hypothetical protein